MSLEKEQRRASEKRALAESYVTEMSEKISESLDRGTRTVGSDETWRVRHGPTRKERFNRALKELRPSAFKVHMLMWEWRGAPAKGNLPFFTIRSLSDFCHLTRPTIRAALEELEGKHWVVRGDYNVHYKNAQYRLVPIRRVPLPGTSCDSTI